MNAVEVGQYLIDVGTFPHLHEGVGALDIGSKADLAASSLSKTMTFNAAPALSVIHKPEMIPDACPPRGRTLAWTCCPLVLI
jgi:hypothetical protein